MFDCNKGKPSTKLPKGVSNYNHWYKNVSNFRTTIVIHNTKKRVMYLFNIMYPPAKLLLSQLKI